MTQVSIITPTFRRPNFLKETRACFQDQTFQDSEWLVLDDSPEPDPDFARETDDRVRYFHSPNRMCVGEKRNKLVEASAGEIIIHFDDDDYYGPTYVEDALNRLRAAKDILLLSGFFVAPLNLDCFGYYLTQVKRGLGFSFGKNNNQITPLSLESQNIPWIHLAWGFSYVYKRKVWEAGMFRPLPGGEDKLFVSQAVENGFIVGDYQDQSANTIHSVHSSGTSNCFSQFLVPPFMLQKLNQQAFDKVNRLKEIHRTETAARRYPIGSRSFAVRPSTAWT